MMIHFYCFIETISVISPVAAGLRLNIRRILPPFRAHIVFFYSLVLSAVIVFDPRGNRAPVKSRKGVIRLHNWQL